MNKIVVSLIGINRHKRIDDEYLEDLLVQDLEGGSIINIHWISDDKAIVTLKSQDGNINLNFSILNCFIFER